MRWTWTDRRGKKQARVINTTVDIRKYEGTAMYPLLFMAANNHLSYPDMLRWLQMKGNGAERPLSWLRRRRWMLGTEGHGTALSPGAKANADGQDARAVILMRANPTQSAAKLVKLLGEHGIKRGREWVRENRCRDQ